MSARTRLAADLATALPTFRIMGVNADLDAVARPTVMLWQSLVTRADHFGLGRLVATLDVWVLTGRENPEKADDNLDASLLAVIATLQPLTWIDWTAAERGVLLERFHGYKITATAHEQTGA